MTLISAAVKDVQDFANRPILAYHEFPQTDKQLFADACFTALMPLCRDASAAERNEALSALAPVIATVPDVFQASRIAMLCGVLVEWGGDPMIAAPAILERLTKQIPLAATVNADNETTLFAEAPDAVKAWKGLRYMVMPAMTMLCLDVNLRLGARRNAALVEVVQAMSAHHREVKFIERLLNLADGEELIVLHPQENKGYRVRLEAISSNFHLFSLLQEALVGDPTAGMLAGPRSNKKVIATARGDIPHDRLITDSAVWHYYNWHGLLPEAEPATAWITGEATPGAIPLIDGDRVVILGPPIPASRSWDSSFFTNLHDALRSKVEVMEILSADEVALRLRRIRKAAC